MGEAKVARFVDRKVEKTYWRLHDMMLFRLSYMVPVPTDTHGIASMTNCVIVSGLSQTDANNLVYQIETFVFAARADFTFINGANAKEIYPGSFKGDIDHARALYEMGIDVIE